MNKRPSTLVHASSGVISLLLLASTILILPPIPPFGSAPDEIVRFYASHATRGYVYQFVAGLALLCALWFLSYLYARLRREDPQNPMPILMLAAGTAWISVAIVYLGLFQIFSVWAKRPETHSILWAFSDAYVLGFMFSVLPAAVTVAAGALSMRADQGWPRWLKPLAGVVLVVQVLGAVPLLVPEGPLRAGELITYSSVFADVLWLCAASIAAVRAERAGVQQGQETVHVPASL